MPLLSLSDYAGSADILSASTLVVTQQQTRCLRSQLRLDAVTLQVDLLFRGGLAQSLCVFSNILTKLNDQLQVRAGLYRLFQLDN